MSRALAQTRMWMDACTDRFLQAVDALDAEAWEHPTRLPGWRPRELVGHVHHNAQALRNLAYWARTGVETPMYDSREQRDADITATSALPPKRIRELVTQSAADLAQDLDALTSEDWKREVVTATGRTVPATEIVWIRVREVGIHAVDLGTGASFADMDEQLLEALVHDVVGLRLRRGEGATLAAWLTGRGVAGEDLAAWI